MLGLESAELGALELVGPGRAAICKTDVILDWCQMRRLGMKAAGERENKTLLVKMMIISR